MEDWVLADLRALPRKFLRICDISGVNGSDAFSLSIHGVMRLGIAEATVLADDDEF